MRARRTKRSGRPLTSTRRRAGFGTGPRVHGVSHATRPADGRGAGRGQAPRRGPRSRPPERLPLVRPDDRARWSEVAGWKCCAPCSALLPGGLAAVLSRAARRDRRAAPRWSSCASASRATTRLLPRPLGHRSRTAAAVGARPRRPRRAWARTCWRAARPRHAAPRTRYGTGCAWCGVGRSTRWTRDAVADRPRPARATGRRLRRVRAVDRPQWRATRTSVAGAPARLLRRDAPRTDGRHLRPAGVPRVRRRSRRDARAVAVPRRRRGGKLRAQVIRTYPRLVTLTDRERRVLALERAVAEVEHPPERPPLARL